MALTLSVRRRTIYGNRRIVYVDATFPNPYTTGGGESLTPANVGLTSIDRVDGDKIAVGTHIGKSAAYDYTNQKLVAFVAANTEAGAVDLSAMTVRLEIVGQ